MWNILFRSNFQNVISGPFDELGVFDRDKLIYIKEATEENKKDAQKLVDKMNESEVPCQP